MRTSSLLTAAVIGAALAVPWSRTVAQQPDSATRRPVTVISNPPSLTIDTFTRVVVAPAGSGDTLSLWTTGRAVATTTRLKPARLPPRGHLLDRRHAALSVLPPDVVLGYVLAAPGIAPTLVRGAIPRVALEDSVTAFLRRYRALHR